MLSTAQGHNALREVTIHFWGRFLLEAQYYLELIGNRVQILVQTHPSVEVNCPRSNFVTGWRLLGGLRRAILLALDSFIDFFAVYCNILRGVDPDTNLITLYA